MRVKGNASVVDKEKLVGKMLGCVPLQFESIHEACLCVKTILVHGHSWVAADLVNFCLTLNLQLSRAKAWSMVDAKWIEKTMGENTAYNVKNAVAKLLEYFESCQCIHEEEEDYTPDSPNQGWLSSLRLT